MGVLSDDERERLLITAIDVLAEKGSAGFDVREIARRTEFDLVLVLEEVGTVGATLRALARHLDHKMVGSGSAWNEEGLSVRERLFELVMQRFDAMSPFKSGLERLTADRRSDPLPNLQTLCNLDRSAGWMLATAGVNVSGMGGGLRRAAMAQAYARVVRVWLRDSSPDLGPTMAELDKRLAELEDWASGLARFARFDRRRSEDNAGTPKDDNGLNDAGEAPVA
ncbi:MAG: hypothetical protein AAFY56_06550 [Pseudomonadota bacterium]